LFSPFAGGDAGGNAWHTGDGKVGSKLQSGLLFLIAGTSQAGISYCGPGSYEYIRSLKWEHAFFKGVKRAQVALPDTHTVRRKP